MFGKQKVLVEIIGEEGIKSRKKYPIEGDKVIIKKGKTGRGHAAYAPTFDRNCFVYYKAGLFRTLQRKLILMEDAEKCVSFKDKDNVDLPSWDRPSLEHASEATVLKAAGASMQKIQIPVVLYILLFVSVALGIIQILLMTGRLKI